MRGSIFLVTLVFFGHLHFAHAVHNNSNNGGNRNGGQQQPGFQSSPVTDSSQYGRGEVNRYIQEDLKGRFEEFNYSLKIKELVPFYERYFSESSAKTLQEVIAGFMRDSYGNSIILAKPGRGKSFLIDQLTTVMSYSVMPEYAKTAIGLDNPHLKLFYEHYLNKTQVILVNADLLSLDPTLPGEPWPSQEVRMKLIVTGLFRAAKDDFLKRGMRTLFLFDEVAILPDLVKQTMKKPLDGTGFKNPDDEFERAKDTGIMVAAFTTPNEYRKMVDGDRAVERRYSVVRVPDMSTDEAFDIMVEKEDSLKKKKGGVEVDPEAIGYLIRMNNILNSPPQAMPAAGLAALGDLYRWFDFNASDKGVKNRITLQDAQRFLIHRVGLTDAWLPGPNGEQPFYDLAERVKRLVADQDTLVDAIAMKLKAWVRLDFGEEVPVFLIGGPSGSGKNTLVKAFNQVLFGNNGDHLVFPIGAKKGHSIDGLISGTDKDMPLILQRMEDGSPPAALTFDEAKDASSFDLLKFKDLFASGRISPQSNDPEPRYLRFPVFVLSQHGEEFFDGLKDDTAIAQRYAKITSDEIDNAFLRPSHTQAGVGEVSFALLQRIKKTGGVFVTKPVAKAQFRSIVDLEISRIQASQKARNNIDIEVKPELREAIVRFVVLQDQGPRVLEANVARFVKTALSEASQNGVPLRDGKISISIDKVGVAISHGAEGSQVVEHVTLEHLLGKEAVPCERLLTQLL